MKQARILIILLLTIGVFSFGFAETGHDNHNHKTEHKADAHKDHGHDGHDHSGHDHKSHDSHGEDAHGDHGDAHHGEFDPAYTAMHHIADANVYSIGPWSIPLPCIVKVKGQGFKIFSSGKFEPGHHGDGHYAYDNFVLNGGALNYVPDANFPKGKVEVAGFGHKLITKSKTNKKGEVVVTEKEVGTVKLANGQEYVLEEKSTLDGGLFGGGMTSFMDFSLTKNVVSMIIVFIIVALMFRSIAKAYARREGQAPKGLQSFIEPVFAFIQDEVAKPILGDKWYKYQPFLMSLFFFILGLNLYGQVPFFGGSNVTGHISVTIALALFTALVVNLSGNSHYWGHIFNMPGIPAPVKLIITPVEILGVFLKPITLFIRLFGNISAGHMVIVIFVGLIFVFGESGANIQGGTIGVVMSTFLTMFMLALELLVAFLQAFVFTILTAVYIGAAVEEHH